MAFPQRIAGATRLPVMIDYPLELEWGAGHLIYYSGKGVIVGPDGISVLVGYSCP
jgi:hypothetical protein